MQMRSVAYYRRSTIIQQHSIEMQRQMAINSSIKHMTLIDEEYIDDAISGRKTEICERPAMRKLLQDIKNEKVEKLFVYKRDRLARDAMQYLEIYQLLKEKEVEVIFTADNEFPLQYSPAGELVELLMAGIIQREGEQIVERISETIKANFQRGKFAGNLPFGYSYNRQTKEIVRNESELTIVKFIYEQVINGQSMKEIINDLAEQNQTRQGKPWTPNSIRNIITNSTYMGDRFLKISGEQVKSRYDSLAIIDEETWIRAQEILQQSACKRATIDKPAVTFPLEGLLVCNECQGHLVGMVRTTNGQTKAEYKCKNHLTHRIDKEFIEKSILRQCREYFQSLLSTHLEDLFYRYHKQNLQTIQRNLLEIEKKILESNRQLMSRTEKWFLEANPTRKETLELEVFKTYDKLKELERLKELMQNQMEVLEKLKNKIHTCSEHTIVESMTINNNDFSVMVYDLVSKVIVDRFSIEVVCKHPFLSVKEVLPYEAV